MRRSLNEPREITFVDAKRRHDDRAVKAVCLKLGRVKGSLDERKIASSGILLPLGSDKLLIGEGANGGLDHHPRGFDSA